MKKILFILVILMTNLSFALPNWIDKEKVKAEGYIVKSEIVSSGKFSLEKKLDNGDILGIMFVDSHKNEDFKEVIFEEENILKKNSDKNRLMIENNKVWVAEYNNDIHPDETIYCFVYFFTINDYYVIARYYSYGKEKLSEKTLNKLSGQIFDRATSFSKEYLYE